MTTFIPLTYGQFRYTYITARISGGDGYDENMIETSWRAYQRDPVGHFISKEEYRVHQIPSQNTRPQDQ